MRIGASVGILANDLKLPELPQRLGAARRFALFRPRLSGSLRKLGKGCQHTFEQCVLEEQAVIGVAR